MRLLKSVVIIGVMIMSLYMIGCSDGGVDKSIEVKSNKGNQKSKLTIDDYKQDIENYWKMNEYAGYIQENQALKYKDELTKDVERMCEKISKLEMVTPEGKEIQETYPELIRYVNDKVGHAAGNEEKLNKELEKMMFGNDKEYTELADKMNKLHENLDNKFRELGGNPDEYSF